MEKFVMTRQRAVQLISLVFLLLGVTTIWDTPELEVIPYFVHIRPWAWIIAGLTGLFIVKTKKQALVLVLMMTALICERFFVYFWTSLFEFPEYWNNSVWYFSLWVLIMLALFYPEARLDNDSR